MTETQYILHNQALILSALASMTSNSAMSEALLKAAEGVANYFKEVEANLGQPK